jgi:hypothetical protein
MKDESIPATGVVWAKIAGKIPVKLVPVPTTAVDPLVTASVPVV